jgi:hypothetical protein
MKNEFRDSDRRTILSTIADSLHSIHGDPEERRHLLDTLNFVSGRIHDAKTAAEFRVLKMQIELLSQQIESVK